MRLAEVQEALRLWFEGQLLLDISLLWTLLRPSLVLLFHCSLLLFILLRYIHFLHRNITFDSGFGSTPRVFRLWSRIFFNSIPHDIVLRWYPRPVGCASVYATLKASVATLSRWGRFRHINH